MAKAWMKAIDALPPSGLLRSMLNFLLVALGGGMGAAMRYGVSIISLRQFGPHFPMGTLIVNWVGSFLMGLLIVALIRKLDAPQPLQLFLATGVLGGFTTFSAFSLDAINLMERGDLTTASFYVIASVIGAIVACFLGLFLGRMVF